MAQDGQSPRRGAIRVLDAVLGDGLSLPEAVDKGVLDQLPPAGRARAQRLATMTLRELARADMLLDPHLRRATPLTVMNALRLGTVELGHGEAAHGVVDAMVGLVGRHRKHGRLKGLVNAVLRKVAGEAPEAWPELPVPELPAWLRIRLVDAWGEDAVTAMEVAHLAGAPLDLTVKPGASPIPEAERLPTGSLRIAGAVQVSALPGYDTGDFWVQDAAAALPARILAPKPGERVLDLCAAPGGKTLQLALAGADVTALDLSAGRLKRLRENLARTGLSAKIVTGDALKHEGTYDAILLDAPCSATGTIRRHPDLPQIRDGSELAELTGLQSRMIDHAWTLLAPGGRLVFCTCSLLPEEGEAQLDRALQTLAGAVADADALRVEGVEPGWISPAGGLRLRPDYWAERGGMDGFFVASLRKSA